MKTSATERIEKLVPGIVSMMPNDDAYELIANKLEEQNEALKLAVEALKRIENGEYVVNVTRIKFSTYSMKQVAYKALAEIRKLRGEK